MKTEIGMLTWEKNGEWGLKYYDIKKEKVPGGLYGALYKLHKYERTGLSPEQIEDINRELAEQAKELQQYQAKELQRYREIGTVEEFRELMAGLVGALGLQRGNGAAGGQCLEEEAEGMEQGWKGYFAARFGKVE